MLRVRFDNVDKENSVVLQKKKVENTPLSQKNVKNTNLQNRALKDITNSTVRKRDMSVSKPFKANDAEVEIEYAPPVNCIVDNRPSIPFDHLAKPNHVYSSQLKMLQKAEERERELEKFFEMSLPDGLCDYGEDELTFPLPF